MAEGVPAGNAHQRGVRLHLLLPQDPPKAEVRTVMARPAKQHPRYYCSQQDILLTIISTHRDCLVRMVPSDKLPVYKFVEISLSSQQIVNAVCFDNNSHFWLEKKNLNENKRFLTDKRLLDVLLLIQHHSFKIAAQPE